MGTTFQGQGPVRRGRGGSERRSLLDTFVDKLKAIGARDDEIEGVRLAWAADPPEPDEVEWMRFATDAELLHALRQTRVENDETSTTFGGGESEPEGATAEGAPPPSIEQPEPQPVDAEALAAAVDAAAPEQNEPEHEPEPEQTSEAVTIPDDVETVPQFIDWVGDDADRALVALDAERQRPTPRVTLIDALEALLNAATE